MTEATVTDRWCILRTSGAKTLPLVESLKAAGFEVWTPTETVDRLVWHGKSKVPRSVTGPILPTFVFARGHQHASLVALASNRAGSHLPFSVFRPAGHTPFIGEGAISGLREIEESRQAERFARQLAERIAALDAIEKEARVAKMKREADKRRALRRVRRDFTTGAAVAVTGVPPLEGLPGQIVKSNGTSAVVFFGGSLTMKVEAWQIAEARVEGAATSTA